MEKQIVDLLYSLGLKLQPVLNAIKTEYHYSPIGSIIQFIVIALIVYLVLRTFKGTVLPTVYALLGLLIFFMYVSYFFKLTVLLWLFEKILLFIPLCIVILYKEEIRRGLNVVVSSVNDIIIPRNKKMLYDERTLAAISAEVMAMSLTSTGALIAIQQRLALDDEISTGKRIDAKIYNGSMLLHTIFYNKSPLHDGAVIINNGIIVAAGCVLPLCKNREIQAKTGLRHQAAYGLSERTDAIVIVVSEENGSVQLMRNETVEDITSQEALLSRLKDLLLKKEKQDTLISEKWPLLRSKFRFLTRVFSGRAQSANLQEKEDGELSETEPEEQTLNEEAEK